MSSRTSKQERYFKKYFEKNNMLYALKSLELINKYHQGLRRDGQEERSHLFEVLGMVISNYNDRMNASDLEKLIVVAGLHDLVEDYKDLISFKDLKKMFPLDFILSIKKLTKWETFKKTEKDYNHYHNKIKKDKFAVIIKAIDRIHNLNSCSRVFSIKRKEEYIKETEKYIIPNLKHIRKEFKELYIPITNLIYSLKNHIEQLNYIMELEKKVEVVKELEKTMSIDNIAIIIKNSDYNDFG